MSITFDDFAKLEIRIGTIEAVELVDGADRLLKLTVNVGEETPRQILSGIREFITEPENLVGKQCPFVLNLEPRMIRGLESQGMIMAGGEGEVFTLLHPGQPVSPGTLVR
jgi:methionine--tRNA ligase beta chain